MSMNKKIVEGEAALCITANIIHATMHLFPTVFSETSETLHMHPPI
jgi:hypothetical protein